MPYNVQKKSNFKPNESCDCVRCCVALLDKHRDVSNFHHNYMYSYCLWLLQFGTRSFFINKNIMPVIRIFGDIKMPTFIVPFKRTSRARFSLPVLFVDSIPILVFFNLDIRSLYSVSNGS